MKNQTNISYFESTFGKKNKGYDKVRKVGVFLFLIFIAGAFVIIGCEDSATDNDEDNRVIVEVTSSHNQETGEHMFVTDTEEVPSGWVTFRFTNATENVHFLLLDLLPADKTVEDSKSEVVPIFQDAMDLITEGKPNEGFAKLGELPAWSAEIIYMGGPGLVSGGNTIETTVFLPPGNYAMECYIKTEDGTFHSSVGMIEGLVVTSGTSDAPEPSDANIQMTLTNEGFGVDGDLQTGTNKVAVLFDEDEPPFLGNDVHLAKLDAETDIATVTAWMEWSSPTGLISTHDAPAPAEFLGGTHEMPKGNTAYFTVDLEPGRYAWISERPASIPLFEEFTIQ